MARLTKKELNEAVHRLFSQTTEAANLRAAAKNWVAAGKQDDRSGTDSTARDEAEANRELMSAALDFANAVQHLTSGPLGHFMGRGKR